MPIKANHFAEPRAHPPGGDAQKCRGMPTDANTIAGFSSRPAPVPRDGWKILR